MGKPRTALFVAKALYEAANLSVTFQYIVYQLSSTFPKQYFLETVIQYLTPLSCSISPESNMMNVSRPLGLGLGNWFVVFQLLIIPQLFVILIPAVPQYLSYGATCTKNILIALKYKEQFTPFVQH